MPLGIERINPKTRPPNPHITFITPLPGDDNAIARDFLERVAAMVVPIMRDNGLAVMSLDEFPANREFWGRNFNAGEVIQLVLKSPSTGVWLPFGFVLGVMVHELTHVKQMNHSKSFWSLNSKYSTQLRQLRARGYTGEGFWSAGRALLSEKFTQDKPLAEGELPKSLCGGTYRYQRNKRKNSEREADGVKKTKITYAERQRRRRERKFGTGEGVKVGGEGLENAGKSRPRVAQSVRGRELRAAAALKRFEEQKAKVEEVGEEEGSDSGSGSGSDGEKKVDVGGGKYLVPVSLEDDGEVEQDWLKRELVELKDACGRGTAGSYFYEGGSVYGKGKGREQQPQPQRGESSSCSSKSAKPQIVYLISDGEQEPPAPATKLEPPTKTFKQNTLSFPPPKSQNPTPPSHTESKPSPTNNNPPQPTTCAACSFTNDPTSTLCCVCANVLNPAIMKNAWKCPCYGDLPYLNPRDAGVCGICGGKRGVSKRNYDRR